MLAILVLNRVWFLYSNLELGMLLRRSYFFIIIDKTTSKSCSKLMFRATVSATTAINRISNFWEAGRTPPPNFSGSTPLGFHQPLLCCLLPVAFYDTISFARFWLTKTRKRPVRIEWQVYFADLENTGAKIRATFAMRRCPHKLIISTRSLSKLIIN